MLKRPSIINNIITASLSRLIFTGSPVHAAVLTKYISALKTRRTIYNYSN